MKRKAQHLAHLWTQKWLQTMKKQGKKVTEKGLKNYQQAAYTTAKFKLYTNKAKQKKQDSSPRKPRRDSERG